MQKLAIGMRVNEGFTLIELLVVVIIIAIGSSVAILSFGDFGAKRSVEVAGEELKAYVMLLEQVAMLEGNSLGVAVTNEAYSSYRLKDGRNWQVILGSSLFRKHFFPKNTVVTFNASQKERLKVEPAIVIDSLGYVSVFTLGLGNREEPDIVQLSADLSGRIKLQKVLK